MRLRNFGLFRSRGAVGSTIVAANPPQQVTVELNPLQESTVDLMLWAVPLSIEYRSGKARECPHGESTGGPVTGRNAGCK